MELDLSNFTKKHITGKVLIAGSGGADSMALIALCQDKGYLFEVAHLDHCLREESVDERKFVQGYCENNDIPFHYEEINPLTHEGTSNNLESAAREVRYMWLEIIRERRGCQWILTAHHLDDQVETVIMRQTRNSGIRGLRGIIEVDSDRKLLRPLLEVDKKTLEAYLKERGINHVVDISNFDTEYTRNNIRHTVLPSLSLDDKYKYLYSAREATESYSQIKLQVEQGNHIKSTQSGNKYINTDVIDMEYGFFIVENLMGRAIDKEEWTNVCNVAKGRVKTINMKKTNTLVFKDNDRLIFRTRKLMN
jgi:tRNA(Ile)-lysidine synthase